MTKRLAFAFRIIVIFLNYTIDPSEPNEQ